MGTEQFPESRKRLEPNPLRNLRIAQGYGAPQPIMPQNWRDFRCCILPLKRRRKSAGRFTKRSIYWNHSAAAGAGPVARRTGRTSGKTGKQIGDSNPKDPGDLPEVQG
jgi:hypothetical protein